MVTYPKDWTEKTFEQFIKIKRGACSAWNSL